MICAAINRVLRSIHDEMNGKYSEYGNSMMTHLNEFTNIVVLHISFVLVEE